jgi:hypothetical protein
VDDEPGSGREPVPPLRTLLPALPGSRAVDEQRPVWEESSRVVLDLPQPLYDDLVESASVEGQPLATWLVNQLQALRSWPLPARPVGADCDGADVVPLWPGTDRPGR